MNSDTLTRFVEAAPSLSAMLTAGDAPRAAMVWIDHEGTVQSKPIVGSVLKIETELFDHLDDRILTDDWLAKLRDYCATRLQARAEADATGGVCCPVPGGWEIRHAPGFMHVQVVEAH